MPNRNFEKTLLDPLSALRAPVLTVYVDTNPANPRNQGRPTGAATWVKSRAKELAEQLPGVDPKELREQGERIVKYLNRYPARAKGMLFFAGPKAWKVQRLQVPVEDEMYWGEPSLGQLLWLLDEHRPFGVVVVDRGGARFFRYQLGQIEEQRADRFEIDASQWRRRDLVAGRGRDREQFRQRLEAQYERLFKGMAERCRVWLEREQLSALFVAGPTDIVNVVWDELPESLRAKSAQITGLPARVTQAALLERLEPEAEAWRRAREVEDVQAVLEANSDRVSRGIDETLARIQDGRARKVFVAQGLRGRVRVCPACGFVDRSSQVSCPACGAERDTESLRTAFPAMAHAKNVAVDVVSGEAAERLGAAEGMAAWLSG